MRTDPSVQHPPSHDILRGFATSNSTSNLFLGAAQRPWMTGASSTAAGAVPQVNHSIDPRHSRPTRVQKEGEVNTTRGDGGSVSQGDSFTTSNPPAQNGPASPTIIHPIGIRQSSQHLGSILAPVSRENSAQVIPTYPQRATAPMVSQPASATPQTASEPQQTVPSAIPRQSSWTDLPPLQTTPRPSGFSLQNTEPLRFSTGPSASPPMVVASENTTPATRPLQTPTLMSPTSAQFCSVGSRKRPSEAQLDDPSRHTRSRSNGQIPTPSTTPTLPVHNYSAQLLEATGRLRQQQQLSVIDEQRISLLRDACQCEDLFYLILHQVYCLAALDRALLNGLNFNDAEFAGLGLLEPILVHNSRLTPRVHIFFSNFPGPASGLFEPANISSLNSVRLFLTAFGKRWALLRSVCMSRGFPPSTVELVCAFAVSSPITQKTLYNSLHRQLNGNIENNEFGHRAIDLLVEDQLRFAKFYGRAGVALNDDFVQQEAKRFGHIYRQLQLSFGIFQPQNFVNNLRPPNVNHSAPANFSHVHEQLGTRQVLSLAPSQLIQQYQAQPANVEASSSTRPIYSPGLMLRTSQHQQFSQSARLVPEYQQPPMVSQQQQAPRGPNSMPQAMTHPPNMDVQMYRQPAPLITGVPPLLTEHRLLPPPGYPVPYTTNPNPDRVALHQSYLRSPIIRKLNSLGKDTPDLRLYQYVHDFVLEPQKLEPSTIFKEWHFHIDQATFARKAFDTPSTAQLSSQNQRIYQPGSLVFRLKAMSRLRNAAPPQPSDFSVSATSWPHCCFISINDHPDVELRRKQHHAKDLPADLTHLIRPGDNVLRISNHSSPEEAGQAFFFAIERIHVVDHVEAAAMASIISTSESLTSITSALKNNADDEISFADPFISIDIVDPFMATVWRTPTRGKFCKHRECFDLQAFLKSRTSKLKGGPTNPDQWMCPICKKDARPQMLVVDEFLIGVRKDLWKNGRLDAKAILVWRDGRWEARFEKGKGSGGTPKSTPKGTPAPALGGDGDDMDAEEEIDLNGLTVPTDEIPELDGKNISPPIEMDLVTTPTPALDRAAVEIIEIDDD